MLLSAPLESFNVYIIIVGLMSSPLSWQNCLLKWCKPYLYFTLRPTHGSFLLSPTPSPSSSLRPEVFLIIFPHLSFSTKSVLPTGELVPQSSRPTLLLWLNSLTNSTLGRVSSAHTSRSHHWGNSGPELNRNLMQKPWWNHACWTAHTGSQTTTFLYNPRSPGQCCQCPQ